MKTKSFILAAGLSATALLPAFAQTAAQSNAVVDPTGVNSTSSAGVNGTQPSNPFSGSSVTGGSSDQLSTSAATSSSAARTSAGASSSTMAPVSSSTSAGVSASADLPPATMIVVAVPSAPPSPRQEMTPTAAPASSPNARWVAGHYTWKDNQWVWQAGAWQTPPVTGATYVEGKYDAASSQWSEGHWMSNGRVVSSTSVPQGNSPATATSPSGNALRP